MCQNKSLSEAEEGEEEEDKVAKLFFDVNGMKHINFTVPSFEIFVQINFDESSACVCVSEA